MKSSKNTDFSALKQIKRKKTRAVKVSNLLIGGNNPIVVQEMTSTYTADIDETVEQIKELEEFGCGLIRVAVPDIKSAVAIRNIKEQIEIPIIADIHFNYRLALRAVENGCDKLRINPGNIGGKEKVAEVVAAAKERGISIRVGVNSGSLEKSIQKKYNGITAEGMVESALQKVSLLERLGFYDTVISLKSPDIDLTVESNKLLSSKVDYPIHIGITESGYGQEGKIRSVAGLGTLLLNGIGDTIRVSLTTSDRKENLRVCYELLKELGVPYV
jgi:(E)-4-hydroxy-3-methylbut-2-enyl-diphosphate synthase